MDIAQNSMYKKHIKYSLFPVSYDNTKMHLHWSDVGVSVSPELKLLQYHIGQPLTLEAKYVYTNEKNGTEYFPFSSLEVGLCTINNIHDFPGGVMYIDDQSPVVNLSTQIDTIYNRFRRTVISFRSVRALQIVL